MRFGGGGAQERKGKGRHLPMGQTFPMNLGPEPGPPCTFDGQHCSLVAERKNTRYN